MSSKDKTASEPVKRAWLKKKARGLVEVRVWVKPEDRPLVRQYAIDLMTNRQDDQ